MNDVYIFLAGTLIGAIIAFFIIYLSNKKHISNIILLKKYLTDEAFELSANDFSSLSELGREILALRNTLHKKTQEEFKIIGTTVMILGKIARGEFDDRLNNGSQFPLYQSLITEINRTSQGLESVIDNINQLASNFLIETKDANSCLTNNSSKTTLDAVIKDKMSCIMNAIQIKIETEEETKSEVLAAMKKIYETTNNIKEISSRIKRIDDFVGLIDKIAMSTNILALNASVEAASAGASGKGFAVVAGEVRLLAENSTSIAKNIRDLSTEATQIANAGELISQELHSTFEAIITKIESKK